MLLERPGDLILSRVAIMIALVLRRPAVWVFCLLLHTTVSKRAYRASGPGNVVRRARMPDGGDNRQRSIRTRSPYIRYITDSITALVK